MEMKILAVAQQKGGVGKTTTAANTAFEAAEAGARVLVIDLDTGDLSKTLARFRLAIPASALFLDDVPTVLMPESDISLIAADQLLANLIYMPLETALRNFRANLSTFAQQGYDLCVIDTAPGVSIALAAALHAADAVISPVEMEDYSIEGIKKMMRVILNARQRNPKLKFLGLLPSMVDRRNPRQVRHLEEVRAAHEKLLAPVTIGLRSSVAEALASGEPVWKSKKTSARAAGAEMRALGQYIRTKMGVKA
ncbi:MULTISPECIES: ParA family protein [Achromobacter]|uniref:ParA family protein n=1 Tax=Achromobacter TaxID=222 RepID=UPI000A8D8CAC|nr:MULTISPECIES: ParA family protein [unclassified Achromobacter]